MSTPKTRVYAVRIKVTSKYTVIAEFKRRFDALINYWHSMTGDSISVKGINHETFKEEIEEPEVKSDEA